MKRAGLFVATGALFVSALVAVSLLSPLRDNAASALSGADFNPGRIIDDAVFYNEFAMNAAAVQSFLEGKVPACDTNGSQPASEFGRPDLTRAQYAASRGWHAPPYTCLRDYRQNTPQMEAASGLCEGIPAGGNRSAAQIIYDIARACHINPQVLIVLLQKEQSLVTDTWPLNGQYQNAIGFACPDTAPCDPSYGGYFYQVYYAARQFQIYKKYPNSYNYVAGRNNNIYFNPDLGRCGSSQIYIENQATAALYIYTPYQPNAAALNNLYGTGDSCSAYGNRNFWRLFRDWFGSTYGSIDFVGLDDARWMELTTSTKKIDPLTGEQVDGTLASGTRLKFETKTTVLINGHGCLRTQSDTTYNYRKCIPLNLLRNIVLEPEAITPVTMRTTKATYKYDMLRDKTVHDEVSAPLLENARQLTFSGRVVLGDKTYYVTSSDMTYDFDYGLLSTDVSSATPTYQSVETTAMELSEATTKVLPSVGTPIDGSLGKGLVVRFASRANVGGTWYYRSEKDTGLFLDKAIPASKLIELGYISLDRPRWMRINANTQKVSPMTLSEIGAPTDQLTTGQTLRFEEKIFVNGQWYYRTESDTTHDIDKAVLASRVSDIQYEAFSIPRVLELSVDTQKFVPADELATGTTFSEGLQLRFVSKILINGQWYYRTESDTQYGRNLAIPANRLREL